jgi:hypothetical protein
MANVKTTKIGGNADYAKVADRLKKFWEDSPFGKINTKHEISGEYIIFTTEIIADQSKEFSKTATGSAMEKLGKVKSFEKTESISVGRALALLGYLASGEIASSEEMEEFYSEKERKKIETLEVVEEKLSKASTRDEVITIYNEYVALYKDEVTKMCTARNEELKKA